LCKIKAKAKDRGEEEKKKEDVQLTIVLRVCVSVGISLQPLAGSNVSPFLAWWREQKKEGRREKKRNDACMHAFHQVLCSSAPYHCHHCWGISAHPPLAEPSQGTAATGSKKKRRRRRKK
jgi:hypothetical protein